MRIRVQSFNNDDNFIVLPRSFTISELVAELVNLKLKHLDVSKLYLTVAGCRDKYNISLQNPSDQNIEAIIYDINDGLDVGYDTEITVLIAEPRNKCWLGGHFSMEYTYQTRLNKLGLTVNQLPNYLSKINLENHKANSFIDVYNLEKYLRTMEIKNENGLLITNHDDAVKFISNCDKHIERLIKSHKLCKSDEHKSGGINLSFSSSFEDMKEPAYILLKKLLATDDELNEDFERPLSMTCENSNSITLGQAKCDLLKRIASFSKSQLMLGGYIDLSDIYSTVKEYCRLEYPQEIKDADLMFMTHRTALFNDSFIGKLFTPSSSAFLRKHGFFKVNLVEAADINPVPMRSGNITL